MADGMPRRLMKLFFCRRWLLDLIARLAGEAEQNWSDRHDNCFQKFRSGFGGGFQVWRSSMLLSLLRSTSETRKHLNRSPQKLRSASACSESPGCSAAFLPGPPGELPGGICGKTLSKISLQRAGQPSSLDRKLCREAAAGTADHLASALSAEAAAAQLMVEKGLPERG